MKAVAVIKDGKVIAKEVFAGDDSQVESDLEKRRKEFPDLEFSIYQEKDIKEFEALHCETEKDKDRVAWQSAKLLGNDSALVFIAQKLGFE